MDPNEILRLIRAVVAKVRNSETAATLDAYATLEEITDSFEGLDEWLSKGGFLPEDWNWQHKPYGYVPRDDKE